MLKSRMLFASAVASILTGAEFRFSSRSDARNFNVAPDFGISTQPMSKSDAAKINAAQAKRDRKNAKRARDAMRGKG